VNILLDTNIIMDALQDRQPFSASAKEIMRKARDGEIACHITANAVADIFYIFKKARNIQSALSALDYLLKNYSVISVTHEDCINALALPLNDFEDALVIVCAKKANVDCIVSRDDQLLSSKLSVPVIAPNELLKIEVVDDAF